MYGIAVIDEETTVSLGRKKIQNKLIRNDIHFRTPLHGDMEQFQENEDRTHDLQIMRLSLCLLS